MAKKSVNQEPAPSTTAVTAEGFEFVETPAASCVSQNAEPCGVRTTEVRRLFTVLTSFCGFLLGIPPYIRGLKETLNQHVFFPP